MTSEQRFYEQAQTFVDRLLVEWPVVATFLGDHRYDHRLGDLTAAGIERQRMLFKEALAAFDSFDARDWPRDAQIDRTLIVQLIKSFLRDLEKLRLPQRDPGGAPNECLQGVYLLVVRDFAPLPERLRNVLARLRETPRVLAEGRALVDTPAVPKVWAEIALESARQGVGLFAGLVPMLAEAVPDLKDELIAAAQTAAGALQDYAAWIETSVLPQAGGEFAAGRELFDELLRESHMVDYDAGELLDTGWRLLADTERQIQAVAAQIDPHKPAKDLLEECKRVHPTADGLLDEYRAQMAAARKFVVDHDIVTIPAGERLRIEPTPSFQRPVIPYAAYETPGFLETMQEGVFIVTPVEEGADAEAAERKLRGHPRAEIPVTAVHEAYPGHHLQLVFANGVGSLPRKIGGFLSPLFIEGWAFYCEELMEQLGFLDQPIQRLARLQGQRWRAARIILDASLHTRGMSVDEGIAFLVERAGLEPDDAKAEVWRYTQSPTQPQSYLMGKLQILEIVAEYRRRHPQATLREMHDAILGCGSLPPKLMRWQLFGEQAQGDKT